MPTKRLVFDSERIGPWVCARTGGHYEACATAIGLETDGHLVGGVLFDQYNGRSIAMHVASEGANWLTREFLKVCFDYPFNQAKVVKIIGQVDSTNTQAIKFDEHVGFQLEATVKDAGKCGDLLIYTMTRQQCRFLTKMGNQNGRQIIGTSST